MSSAGDTPTTAPVLPYRSLVVEVSESCNHACVHCYNENTAWLHEGSRERPLTREEIRSLISQVRAQAPVEQVALSGGEPLLRSDTPEIACDLVEDGANVVVISNLACLDEDIAARFPPGVVFEMTLFSTEPELHDRIAGQPGAHARTLRGALAARRAGHVLALSVVISALNAHEVTRIVKLGIVMGVDTILLNRVNLTRTLLRDRSSVVPTKAQLQQVFAEADRLAAQCETKFAVAIPVPPCVLDLSQYENLHFGFCPRGGADSYYTIGTRGDVRPCNHSSVVLGNLRRQSFREIVSSARASEFWAPTPPACVTCSLPLAAACRGGCVAATDECLGHRMTPDPFVDLALRPAADARGG